MACGEEEECVQVLLWGNVRDGDYLEDLDIDGSTVSRDRKCIYERNIGGVSVQPFLPWEVPHILSVCLLP